MFITCSSAIEFWNQFYKWYTFEPLSRFTNTEILYGIIQNISIEITLNHIILIAKYHIYCNATTIAHLVFVAFLERLKNMIETEKYIAYTSHAHSPFPRDLFGFIHCHLLADGTSGPVENQRGGRAKRKLAVDPEQGKL